MWMFIDLNQRVDSVHGYKDKQCPTNGRGGLKKNTFSNKPVHKSGDCIVYGWKNEPENINGNAGEGREIR